MHNKLTNSFIKKAIGSTYILLIYLHKPHRLLIGKIGWIHLKEGYYIYVGSAKKWMKSRLVRHFLRNKKRYWHIDYILSDPCPSTIVNVWIHREPCECAISQKLYQDKIGTLVKKGLGSSDCHCITHFFKVKDDNLDILSQILSEMHFSSLTGKQSFFLKYYIKNLPYKS
jgi:Uri superfamily endonuclease